MSRTEIYLHVVFAVKRRESILTAVGRRLLFQHIREQAFLNQIHLKAINGVEDHIHLLLRLHACQTIAGVAQQIKGESARWANQVQLSLMALPDCAAVEHSRPERGPGKISEARSRQAFLRATFEAWSSGSLALERGRMSSSGYALRQLSDRSV